MANRSDFQSAYLPRYLKRMMALIPFKDAHERGEWKRAFIQAHDAHREFKNKRQSRADGPAVTESDVTESL
jgi:hypothetical protein